MSGGAHHLEIIRVSPWEETLIPVGSYELFGCAPLSRARIDELDTRHPCYGSRRSSACLQREGLLVNRQAVQRHMREMGIAGLCPGLNRSRRNQLHNT